MNHIARMECPSFPAGRASATLHRWSLVLAIGLSLQAAPLAASPGDLDPLFGDGGSTLIMGGTPVSGGSSGSSASAMAVLTDNEVLVAGYASSALTSRDDFLLVRYAADGSGPNPYFGDIRASPRCVVTDLNNGTSDRATDIAVQSDGRILLTGESGRNNPEPPVFGLICDFVLVRYLAGGTLDSSFGTNGKVISDFSNGGNDVSRCVAVQGDGKILVGGDLGYPSSGLIVARYTGGGALDPTFGAGGSVRTMVATGDGQMVDIAVLADGRILALASSGGDCVLVRYLPNGSLDPTFGIAGLAVSNRGPVSQMALQPDGRILVAGSFYNGINHDQQLSRFLPDGGVDPTFGSGGAVTVSMGGSESGRGVAVRPDGRIVMCGSSYNGSEHETMVTVFQADGTLETAFGDGGIIHPYIRSGFVPTCVALHHEDKILVAGPAYSGSNHGFAIARFDGAAQPEIAVEHPAGTGIGDGAATIDLGTATVSDYSKTVSTNLTIRNTGAATLYLRSRMDGSHPEDFSCPLSDSIPPGGTLDCKVVFRPVASGTRHAVLRFTTNDTDENPFDINLTGTALPRLNIAPGNPLPTATVGIPYSVTFTATGGSPPYQWSASGAPPAGLTFDNGVLSGVPTTPGPAEFGVRVTDSNQSSTYYANHRLEVLGQAEADALDASFGSLGKAASAIGSGNDRVGGMAIQSDGKVVVAGFTNNGTNNDAALLRYQTDGTLDGGFGTGGRLVAPLGASNDYARAAAIQQNGRIVVAGDSFNGSGSDIVVARCLSTGVLDTSYGTGGKTTVTFGASSGEMSRAIAIQADGKAVIAGFTDNATVHDSFALVRLTASGALDATFGAGGKVSTAVQGIDDSANALAIQPDGKIIAAGQSTATDGTTDFALVRYLTDGTPDPTFGTAGKVVVRTSFGNDGASGVVVQGDGRIIAVGSAVSPTHATSDFAMVRLLADGSLDTSFGSYGVAIFNLAIDYAGTPSDDQARSVVLDGDGRLVVAGSSNAAGNLDFAVVRFLSDGRQDYGFGTNGVHLIPVGAGDDLGVGVGLQADGKIVVAGDTVANGNFDIAVVRLMGPAVPAIAVEQPAGYVLTDGGTADCGDPAIGGGPALAQFTVRNAGGADLTGLSVSMDGANAADFTVGALGAASLASGASTTFSISFEPAAAGTRTAAIHITSNDPDHNPFDLVLTGVGRVPPVIATPRSLPQGMAGAAYDLTFAATSGTAPYTWSVSSGSPPEGLGLSAAGLLSGTPAVAGTSVFTVRVTGADGLAADSPCEITIIPKLVAGGTDPTFGGNGRVTQAIGTGNESGQAVVVQPDGRIIVAGYAQANGTGKEDFALVRYLADGTPDVSFGSGGVVTTPMGSDRDFGRCVALQADGRILVAGECWISSSYDIGIARYLTDGTLDPTFGTGGKVIASVATTNDFPHAVMVQADGGIVVAGGADTDFGLIRFTASGALDTSFGNGGKVLTDFNSGSFDYALAAAMQSDGKILVGGRGTGTGGTDFLLARYTPTGVLDTSFDGDGKLSTAVGAGSAGDYCYGLAVQNDGRILAAGYTSTGGDDFAVVRYLTNGTLDTTFGTGGILITGIGSFSDRATGVAVSGDGGIVAAGHGANGSNDDFALVRILPDGTGDPGFGTGGRVLTAIGSGLDRAYAVAIAADGRIILAGESNNGSNLDIALVRYVGPLVPEIAVTQDGITLEDGVSACGFGAAAINGGGGPRQFVITNAGTAPLTGISVSCDGSHGADFNVIQPAATALAPGASIGFTVGFSPVAAGDRQAAIHISSNDGNESPFDIAVSGTGGTPLQVWRLTHFARSDNGGNAADLYDYDGDGVPNVLEYAFAGDPKAANPGILPLMPPLPGGQRAITFRCDATRTDLTYTVQASSTLASGSWTDIARSTGGAATAALGGLATVSDSGNGLRLVTVTPGASLFPSGRGFLRVKVSY